MVLVVIATVLFVIGLEPVAPHLSVASATVQSAIRLTNTCTSEMLSTDCPVAVPPVNAAVTVSISGLGVVELMVYARLPDTLNESRWLPAAASVIGVAGCGLVSKPRLSPVTT